MRVLIDTNVYISVLLYPTSRKPPATLIRTGLSGDYTIITSETLIGEIRRKVAAKPYLSKRITGAEVSELIDLLRSISDSVGSIDRPIPTISRDRADDVHLFHAALAQADYLVSGDPDLLVLGEFEGVRIVSPAGFVAILGS